MQLDTPVKSVPFNYSFLWLKCSARIAEKHYKIFLQVGLFTFLTAIAVALVPKIGTVVSPVLAFIYSLAVMRFVKLIVDNETPRFEEFLNIAFDQEVLKRFRPYLIIALVTGVIELLFTFINLKFLILPFSLIAGILTTATYYAAFTEIKLGTNDPAGTLKYILNGFIPNVLTLLALSILVVLAAGVATMMCFVPLLVVFVPMVVPVKYLIYSAIYEGRNIEQMINEWAPPITQETTTPEVPSL